MTVVLFIAVLVLLIVVHELGHFFVAKFFGIRVDEFGIGYPPRAFVLGRFRETLYTVNWLPFGGFVRIFGERADDSIDAEQKKRAFVHKPRYVQAAVLLAGVVFNLLFAWILFSGALLFGAPTTISEQDYATYDDAKLIVSTVAVGSPAEIVGLTAGDEVLKLESGTDTLDTLTPSAAAAFIQAHAGETLTLTYERSEGEETIEREVRIIPVHGVLDATPGVPAVGIGMALIADRALPIHQAIASGFMQTIDTLALVTVGLLSFFGQAFTGHVDWNQVAGPVGIAALVGDASSIGFVYLLYFTAFISVNLAVINLIPLPALDGGRLLFVGIEAITRKPINEYVALSLNVIGFALIILLMILVTYHDIVRLIA